MANVYIRNTKASTAYHRRFYCYGASDVVTEVAAQALGKSVCTVCQLHGVVQPLPPLPPQPQPAQPVAGLGLGLFPAAAPAAAPVPVTAAVPALAAAAVPALVPIAAAAPAVVDLKDVKTAPAPRAELKLTKEDLELIDRLRADLAAGASETVLSIHDESGKQAAFERTGLTWDKQNEKVYWSEPVLDAVWRRGVHPSERGLLPNANAICYLCSRALSRKKRQCLLRGTQISCPGCDAWEVEHVLPKSANRKAHDVLGNLLPACHVCNGGRFKGSHPLKHVVTKHNSIRVVPWVMFSDSILPITKNELSSAVKRGKAISIRADMEFLDSSEFKLAPNHMGEGSTGNVYQARWIPKDGTASSIVAVKKVLTNLQDKEDATLAEVSKLRLLQHPNVVSYLGTYEKTDTDFKGQESKSLNIVMELMPNTLAKAVGGDTKTAVKAPAGRVLWKYLAEAAQGLEFLHVREVPIVHYDVKPNNILVGEDGVVKLADFGNSRSLATNVTSPKEHGTRGFMAPELGHTPPILSPACDIFSFGGMLAYFMPKYAGRENNIYANHDPDTYNKLKALSVKCQNTDPNARPSVSELRDTLWSYYQNAPAPPPVAEAKK